VDQDEKLRTDDSWATERTAEAQKRHPLVSDAVSLRMAEMLTGKLGTHLNQTELAHLASALIADMVPTPQKTDPQP
jgi:hypothetical protein